MASVGSQLRGLDGWVVPAVVVIFPSKSVAAPK